MLTSDYSQSNDPCSPHLFQAFSSRLISHISLFLMCSMLLSFGCTVIRPGEGDMRGGGTGGMDGGGGGVEEELDPIQVDLLVLATFDKSPIADSYSQIIDHLMAQLALRNVISTSFI